MRSRSCCGNDAASPLRGSLVRWAAVDVALAHQGGWDEALFVAVPIAVFAGLLYVAKRRVDAEEAEERRPPVPPAR